MKNEFDIIVIGGGAGGMFAASTAINRKVRVCLIEKEKIGGDCTWYGCVPSKTLIRSAAVARLLQRKQEFGLPAPQPETINGGDVFNRVRRVRETIYSHGTPKMFTDRGIEVIIGAPEFKTSNTLQVNGRTLRAKKFVISTGSYPDVPPIPGLKDIDYLTNKTIFELNELPESLIVLGGGPIGIELAQAFLRLGVEVSVVEMMDRILPREDEEAAALVEKKLKSEGLRFYTGHKAVKFEKKKEKTAVYLEDKSGNRKSLIAQHVLVAVGRAANTAGLRLEKCGVEYSRSGLKVNAYLQTTNKNIFACGDIAGPYQFSHAAAYTAYVSVRNALFKRPAWEKINYSNMPWAIFSDPELAHLGLTEKEAGERFGRSAIKVYRSGYERSDRAITDAETEGLVKIITSRKGLILGAHIAGHQASEIIQGLLIAKSLKIPLSRLAPLIFVYPTLSEIIKKTAVQPLLESLDNPLLKLFVRMMQR